MENEILAAEIYLHPINLEEETAEIDAEMLKVENALKSYSCTASILDYSVAIISGILAGAVDVFLVGETGAFQKGQQPLQEQLIEAAKKVLIKSTANERVAKPILHSAVEKGIPAMIPQLNNIAIQPNVLGLLASVLIQMGHGGMLKESNNQIQFLPNGIEKEDGAILVIAAVIVGILKWLSTISSSTEEDDQPIYQFKTLNKLRDLIRSVPAFSGVVKDIEKWQKQLPNEIKCDKKSSDPNMGIEKVFCSFFMMLGSVPALSNTNLHKAVDAVREGKRLGLNEIPIVKSLTRQAFPVLINEVIVRTFFFASRLVRELKANEDVGNIDWNNVLPFGNRDIDRLLALSTMTLSAADTADAAMHAAIDSCGNTLLFVSRFVTRFNFVAAGRATFAVIKEISNEKAEEELIHIKRLLMEAKTAKALEILLNYQQQLEKRVSEYLTEDITVFLEGIDCMDKGLDEKNSDLVIRGNVKIQRILGREPQFTNQREFDDLMDSDIALQL